MKSFSTTIILIMMFCGIQQQLVVLQIFFDYNVKSVLSFHRLLVVVAFSRHPLSHKGEQYNKNFHVLIHIISLFLSLCSLLSVYTQPSSSSSS